MSTPREREPSRKETLELIAATLEAEAARLRAVAAVEDAAGATEMAAALRPKDVARRWGVTKEAIYRLVSQKRLRAFRVGTAWSIPMTEVVSYERRRAT